MDLQHLVSLSLPGMTGRTQLAVASATPVFLPGESHGWRSLVGCSPWGRTESDTTETTWQRQRRHPLLSIK